jgi:hypothetical protein
MPDGRSQYASLHLQTHTVVPVPLSVPPMLGGQADTYSHAYISLENAKSPMRWSPSETELRQIAHATVEVLPINEFDEAAMAKVMYGNLVEGPDKSPPLFRSTEEYLVWHGVKAVDGANFCIAMSSSKNLATWPSREPLSPTCLRLIPRYPSPCHGRLSVLSACLGFVVSYHGDTSAAHMGKGTWLQAKNAWRAV